MEYFLSNLASRLPQTTVSEFAALSLFKGVISQLDHKSPIRVAIESDLERYFTYFQQQFHGKLLISSPTESRTSIKQPSNRVLRIKQVLGLFESEDINFIHKLDFSFRLWTTFAQLNSLGLDQHVLCTIELSKSFLPGKVFSPEYAAEIDGILRLFLAQLSVLDGTKLELAASLWAFGACTSIFFDLGTTLAWQKLVVLLGTVNSSFAVVSTGYIGLWATLFCENQSIKAETFSELKALLVNQMDHVEGSIKSGVNVISEQSPMHIALGLLTCHVAAQRLLCEVLLQRLLALGNSHVKSLAGDRASVNKRGLWQGVVGPLVGYNGDESVSSKTFNRQLVEWFSSDLDAQRSILAFAQTFLLRGVETVVEDDVRAFQPQASSVVAESEVDSDGVLISLDTLGEASQSVHADFSVYDSEPNPIDELTAEIEQVGSSSSGSIGSDTSTRKKRDRKSTVGPSTSNENESSQEVRKKTTRRGKTC